MHKEQKGGPEPLQAAQYFSYPTVLLNPVLWDAQRATGSSSGNDQRLDQAGAKTILIKTGNMLQYVIKF